MTRGELVSTILFLVLAALLAAAAVLPTGGGYGYGVYTLEVDGRLLDGETGAPIPGAMVMAFPVREWAEDETEVARFRRMIDARRAVARRKSPGAALGSYPMSLVGGALTDAAGVFTMLVDVPWCVYDSGCAGSDPVRPPPRHGIEALRIEIEGGDPVVLEAPTGTWTEHEEPDGLWATYDVGVVRVP